MDDDFREFRPEVDLAAAQLRSRTVEEEMLLTVVSLVSARSMAAAAGGADATATELNRLTMVEALAQRVLDLTHASQERLLAEPEPESVPAQQLGAALYTNARAMLLTVEIDRACQQLTGTTFEIRRLVKQRGGAVESPSAEPDVMADVSSTLAMMCLVSTRSGLASLRSLSRSCCAETLAGSFAGAKASRSRTSCRRARKRGERSVW